MYANSGLTIYMKSGDKFRRFSVGYFKNIPASITPVSTAYTHAYMYELKSTSVYAYAF